LPLTPQSPDKLTAQTARCPNWKRLYAAAPHRTPRFAFGKNRHNFEQFIWGNTNSRVPNADQVKKPFGGEKTMRKKGSSIVKTL
jgi:hypothetical protein